MFQLQWTMTSANRGVLRGDGGRLSGDVVVPRPSPRGGEVRLDCRQQWRTGSEVWMEWAGGTWLWLLQKPDHQVGMWGLAGPRPGVWEGCVEGWASLSG